MSRIESFSFAGTIGLLRFHRLVAGAARDPAPLHFPPLPQRSHLGRDLEDVVQGAFRIRWMAASHSSFAVLHKIHTYTSQHFIRTFVRF